MNMTEFEKEYTHEQYAATLALLLSGLSMMAYDDMIRAARTIAYLGRVLRGETEVVW